ncbi:MAG: methyltransferase domain-containing protein [Pseudomonadota bacterium]
MSKQIIPYEYGRTFETTRRLHPRIWDADYCPVRGLADAIKEFAAEHVKSKMKVIDFGCGGKPYRSMFPDNCEYIGIDTHSNPHADVTIEPGQIVPLLDAVADCIISTQVVYLIPGYNFYLRDCRRLLRPEGRMFITTHGTWTYHPASGGDYYRFTQDGLRHILREAGFEVEVMFPIVGTLGTGLHLRQLIFNTWLQKMPFGRGLAKLLNIFTNARILVEDKCSPLGTRMSSPVILAAIARPVGLPHE